VPILGDAPNCGSAWQADASAGSNAAASAAIPRPISNNWKTNCSSQLCRPRQKDIEFGQHRARIATVLRRRFSETDSGDRAMKFPCTVRQLGDGRWLARHMGSRLGKVEVTAPSRDETLAKLRGELRYRADSHPASTAHDAEATGGLSLRF
jgi:hypothetical protein